LQQKAEPLKHNDIIFADPLYSDQWHLNNTGQFGGTPGVDVNIQGAWAQVNLEREEVEVSDNFISQLNNLTFVKLMTYLLGIHWKWCKNSICRYEIILISFFFSSLPSLYLLFFFKMTGFNTITPTWQQLIALILVLTLMAVTTTHILVRSPSLSPLPLFLSPLFLLSSPI
jgi:hypothetical protein